MGCAVTKPKLLWIGACGIQTGFARVTHNILSHLVRTWDVSCLGIGYNGDPHKFPWDIYPAQTNEMGDAWGLYRVNEVVNYVKPDVIAILLEPWNMEKFIQNIRYNYGNTIKLLGYCVVDGENMKTQHVYWMDQMDVTVFTCKFGFEQARVAGFKSRKYYIIPHGVDPRVYQPCNRQFARRQIGLNAIVPDGAFIFGNVNMNQPRKRLDISVAAFSKWWHAAGRPDDAYLYLHTDKGSQIGHDVGQLSLYYDVKGRVALTAETFKIQEERMHYIYNTIDVQLSTSAGEGFGLTTLEGMACGIPQIIPQFSALGTTDEEGAPVRGQGGWVEPGAAYHVDVIDTPSVMGKQQNVVRFTPNVEQLVEAMDHLYRDKDERQEQAAHGRQLALSPQFRWSAIACQFDEALRRALGSVGRPATFLVDKQTGGRASGPSGDRVYAGRA